MPVIEEQKLIKLYNEIEEERKVSKYYLDQYNKSRKAVKKMSMFRISFFVLVVIFTLFLLYIFIGNSNKIISQKEIIKVSDTIYIENPATQKLILENKVLAGLAEDVEEILEPYKVYTVQIVASKNKDILLFSDNFVNFRSYPLQNFNAYSLGNFSTKGEAEAFQKELYKLGLRNTWVTAYQTKRRVEL